MSKRLGIIVVSLFFVVAAEAKTWKTETYQFDASGISMVEIDHPVGELEITPGTGDRIVVRMRVECSSWRGRCEKRVRDIELIGDEGGSTLELDIEGFPRSVNHLSVDLEITMPARMSLDIERGVGETRIRGIEGDISLEAGVGEVRIVAPARAVGWVRAECGVGEADLDIPEGRVEREGFLFLGNELKWEGKGQSTIDVELGVGSAEIDLE